MERKKVLVAVSGGVDSVVLLDKLVQQGRYDLTVAHFDHGIRSDSMADARFVAAFAARYPLPFVVKSEKLGANASEDLARTRRYLFLRAEAKRLGAVIMTAHHADDVVETVAINLVRGTGWRGLAVLDSPGIERPLIGVTKAEIYSYALARRLEWVEDSTNSQDVYLRNRMRRKILQRVSNGEKKAVLQLRDRQLTVKREINTALLPFLSDTNEYDRHLFVMIDPVVACELLRAVCVNAGGVSPTRPQCVRALLAIKTVLAGSRHQIGAGVDMRFSQRTFIVETP
jgi:tRNA(Ile)-lysidine synthase